MRIKYKDKFEREIIQKTALKANLSEEHIYFIYKCTTQALYMLMKNPMTERIKVPVIGKFNLNVSRCRTIEAKLSKTLEYLSGQLDGVLRFNFELLANIKYIINKYNYSAYAAKYRK